MTAQHPAGWCKQDGQYWEAPHTHQGAHEVHKSDDIMFYVSDTPHTAWYVVCWEGAQWIQCSPYCATERDAYAYKDRADKLGLHAAGFRTHLPNEVNA